MKFYTSITKYRYPIINFILFILFIFWIIIIREKIKYMQFFAILDLVLIVFFTILNYKAEKIIITGEIVFKDNLITIYDKKDNIIYEFNLNEIDEIILLFVAIKGELSGSGSNLTDLIPEKGGKNKITIKINKKEYKYYIYMETQTEAIRFKMLHRFLLENKINTKFIGFIDK